MQDKYNFTIYGECVAKARPRFTQYGHVYTPAKTKEYERLIKSVARENNIPCITTALKIDITIYKSIPASWTKKKKEQALSGELLPVVKPDIDNYVKAVLDGLNGLLFVDDKQIIELTARKKYSDSARTEVTVWAI